MKQSEREEKNTSMVLYIQARSYRLKGEKIVDQLEIHIFDWHKRSYREVLLYLEKITRLRYTEIHQMTTVVYMTFPGQLVMSVRSRVFIFDFNEVLESVTTSRIRIFYCQRV